MSTSNDRPAHRLSNAIRMAVALSFTLILVGPASAASVYIALGDSITFGETDLRYIPSFGDRGYVGKFADILDSTNGSAPRPTVINLAIDGETAGSFFSGMGRTPPVVGRTDIPLAAQNLNYAGDPTTPQAAKFTTRANQQLALGNTIDTISITLGFNELAALSVLPVDQALALLPATLTTYQANYANLVGFVRSAAPNAKLYLLNYFNPFPADPAVNTADAVFGQGGAQVNAIIQMLATQFNAQYVDTFTPFVGREAELTYIDEFPAGSITPPPYSASDFGLAPIGNVHPNDPGYQVIANQVARVPEPSSVILAALGALGLALRHWKRLQPLR